MMEFFLTHIEIEVLTYTIAFLGVVLVLVLYGRILVASNDARLKKHRSKAEGFSDLLNYAAEVDDGIIVCKNGAFLASWVYSIEDNASSTEKQREMVSMRINQALARLGNGWMINIDAPRQQAKSYSQKEASHFPDPVSAAIDEERRILFNREGTMYQGYFVITLTWLPPLLAQRKFVELMFDDDSPMTTKKARTMGLIEEFKRETQLIEDRLSACMKLTRLKGDRIEQEDGSVQVKDDLLSWLQLCVTGKKQPILLPKNPMYLDLVIGGEEFWTGVVPKVGAQFIQVIAIDGFPLESAPGILSSLSEQPSEYRWSSRFIFLDQHEALRLMDKFRKKWKQKIRGFFDQVFNSNSTNIDQDALSMTQDASNALAEINSGLVASGYYTSNIILMNEDRDALEESSRQLSKAVEKLGFSARIETLNTVEAYLGSLPGHGVENVRRPLINSMNLADLMPTSTIWTGSDTAPCPMYPAQSPPLMQCVTKGSTPFFLNLHVRDLAHGLMFGMTRGGKSTHLAIIAAQMRRYPNMSIYTFDKGMSMYPLTMAVGGSHFAVGADDSRLAFCPMQFLETRSDRAWAMEWIDTILALNNLATTPAQRNEIGAAIVSLHKSGGRTLSEFSLTVQDEDIRQALKQYTVDGTMGHLLDAEKDGLALSNFTTFEIEELMGLGEKYALPVLLYLFRRIECGLQGQPAAILIDEAWVMLGHPVFRERIRTWLKTLAKKNCLVLLATQSLTDAANSGILDVLVESTATKIYLPNPNAKDDDTAALYRRMGLNNRQIDILASAVPQREYYCVSEHGRRLYQLALGPLALSFVGATDKESIAEIQQLVAKYGNHWVDHWLATRGLTLKDYQEDAA